MKVTLRCAPAYRGLVPEPVLARLALPEWVRRMPAEADSAVVGAPVRTLKQCPPFLDAMQTGILFPLAADLTLRGGVFEWASGLPADPIGRVSRAPIGLHAPEQAEGTPFHDPSRFVVKFVNHWTVELPDGWSLLVGHPFNREELPFRTLWGLVDEFPGGLVHFPALWTDAGFEGTLPKGTPVAQAVPVRREALELDIGAMEEEELARHLATEDSLQAEPGFYRRAFRR